MNDEFYMRKAIAVAKRGVDKGQTPFGAVIVKNDKVIVAAHNVVWKTKDITAHAEITAIRVACKKLKTVDLSGCAIYSTTEPCPMCFSAIHWARVDKIVYGASIADAANAGFNELSISNFEMKKRGKSRVVIKVGVLKRENRGLFEYWKQKGGKAY